MRKQRYLYSVYPKRPIKNIVEGIPVIRVNKTLNLNLDEVLGCLKYGSVYRRFANEQKIIKVTTVTAERLHNAKFMTEAEYAAFLEAQIDNKAGTVLPGIDVPEIDQKPEENSTVDDQVVDNTDTTDTTQTQEPAIDVTPEATVDQPVDEVPVTLVDDNETSEDIIPEDTNQSVDEVPVTPVEDNETSADTIPEEVDKPVEASKEKPVQQYIKNQHNKYDVKNKHKH